MPHRLTWWTLAKWTPPEPLLNTQPAADGSVSGAFPSFPPPLPWGEGNQGASFARPRGARHELPRVTSEMGCSWPLERPALYPMESRGLMRKRHSSLQKHAHRVLFVSAYTYLEVRTVRIKEYIRGI